MPSEIHELEDAAEMELVGDATYSPDDDKLRLYPHEWLAEEIYNRVKEADFRWAPKQELFFAKWSPAREDLLFELAGKIGDEDTSLVGRAEERAERFEGYEQNRRREAESASEHRAVSMWSTADYWSLRATGAIRTAKYRQRPDVRARRIKKIEAEIRKYRRSFTPKNPNEQIMQCRWHCPVCREYACKEHPEAQVRVAHVYCGAAQGGSWTL